MKTDLGTASNREYATRNGPYETLDIYLIQEIVLKER